MDNYALVIGLGISGKGAAKLLKQLGYQVIGCDRDLTGKEKLGIALISKKDPLPNLPIKIVVVSPGIVATHPLLIAARARGIEVVGEAELAFRHLSQRCIGVTGTNGKTTLTLLLAHLFNQSGQNAYALGNVGTSLADYVCKPCQEEVVIAELSSFQLERMKTQALDCAIITSITPDHLDRYPSFEAYARAKAQLSYLIRPGGKLFTTKEVIENYGQFFSPRAHVEEVRALSSLQLTAKGGYWGKLDWKKVAFARAIGQYFGLSQEKFLEGLEGFTPPSHRLEDLGEIGGVAFYNDSKATNIAAVLFAINALNRPISLIAGGVDKGGEFADWKGPFKGKVKRIIAIGKAAPLIRRALGDAFCVIDQPSLDKAFVAATHRADRGDAILLSPGCASFDQFLNYEERGERFKCLVANLRRRYESEGYDYRSRPG